MRARCTNDVRLFSRRENEAALDRGGNQDLISHAGRCRARMRKASYLFWIGGCSVVLERFQPPLDRCDRLLMNFLVKRVDCLASGLEAFGRAHDAADDPGDGAANHACREMNRKTSATPKVSSDSRRRASATSSVSMVIPWGFP